MKRSTETLLLGGFLGVALLGGPLLAKAQTPQQQPQQPQQQQPPTPSQPEKGQQPAPLTMDSAPPPVSAEDEAAIKTFRDAPTSDLACIAGW